MASADMFGFPYVRVADDLAARIAAREITGRLPGERTLAQDYEVSYGTVRHALAVLRERGLVITRPMLGSFAVPSEPPAASIPEFLDCT